ncbi:MAG: hypothetical protein NZM12_03605 [Steroidobacteraceae bacterium]|nr:hypothetical protein [Steroidobacteraceae bacterium]
MSASTPPFAPSKIRLCGSSFYLSDLTNDEPLIVRYALMSPRQAHHTIRQLRRAIAWFERVEQSLEAHRNHVFAQAAHKFRREINESAADDLAELDLGK